MEPAGLKARLSDTLRHILMRRAMIAEVEALGGHFHRITLEGVALRNVDWTPGQKMQITMEAPSKHARIRRSTGTLRWDVCGF